MPFRKIALLFAIAFPFCVIGNGLGWALQIATGTTTQGHYAAELMPNHEPVSVGASYVNPTGYNQQKPVGYCQSDELWATVTPYLWLPAMKGQIGAGQLVTDVDISLSDAWNLLGDLKGAAMLHTEIGRGRNGLILDTLLMRIESTENLPNGGTAAIDTSMTFLEGMGFKRFISRDLCGRMACHVNWDFLYGVRYYQIGTGVTIAPPASRVVSVERNESWVDMVFGARTSMKFNNGGHAFARADFGGFGMGSSSEFTWNLIVGVDNPVRWNPKASVVMGYRVLDINQSKGTGTQAFLFDMNMHGPFAGLTYRF